MQPAIPDTGWVCPSEFPNLASCKTIAIDLETYDPDLLSKGPGYVTGNGHVMGIAVGTDDGRRWYFPMRHKGGLDAGLVIKWAKKELTRPGQLKVGANLMYDLGWLEHEGVHVAGPFYDVQWAEALLDEHRLTYSLDSIALDRLEEGKTSNLLYQWCAQAFGGKPDHKQRANIYRAPLALVGPYAEGDVDLPLRVMEQQQAELQAQGLTELCKLEHRLLPMLLAMKFRGVNVDMGARDELSARLEQAEKEAQQLLGGINVNAATDLARLFDSKGIAYPRTAKGAPSFTKDWLEACADPVAQAVTGVRTFGKMRGTFVDGYFSLAHNGRLHCDFHPLRSDAGGTVSGRFSSSNPNLQNIPSRHPVWGPAIRGLFIPDEGCQWAKLDYSQVEYRLLAHYAMGEGAEDVRSQYRDAPQTDFHQMVAEMSGLKRTAAKQLNFGMVYGQGEALTASEMKCSLEEARAFRTQYFQQAPFVKSTSDAVSGKAATRGWIKSLGGRLHRFNSWEPAGWEDKRPALRDYDTAVAAYGNVKRAKTHKGLNALLQGSAADVMKMAMVAVWESGVCDVLGAPHLTVHDELDFSMPMTPAGGEAIREVKHLMETCVQLKVPLIADAEVGTNWANIKEL